jgi:RHH-type rel operon transcriptional repressor/antitoxin RelB
VKRTAENQRKVVAVRVNPQIEQRLRLLAELTGRRQSFFLQQMIEGGIGAMEDVWLSPDVLSRVRSGTMPSRQQASDAISDLFASSMPNEANR